MKKTLVAISKFRVIVKKITVRTMDVLEDLGRGAGAALRS